MSVVCGLSSVPDAVADRFWYCDLGSQNGQFIKFWQRNQHENKVHHHHENFAQAEQLIWSRCAVQVKVARGSKELPQNVMGSFDVHRKRRRKKQRAAVARKVRCGTNDPCVDEVGIPDDFL